MSFSASSTHAHRHHYIGLLGAALLYGDEAITPAISVLSALEGLENSCSNIAPYIVMLSALVLVGLLTLDHRHRGIGKLSARS